jgi:hypothetical protein
VAPALLLREDDADVAMDVPIASVLVDAQVDHVRVAAVGVQRGGHCEDGQ